MKRHCRPNHAVHVTAACLRFCLSRTDTVGRRPAVVVSPGSYNGKVGLAILCPITNQVKGYPFEVRIPPGLNVSGVVLSDQAKSLNWRMRKAEFICKLPQAVTLDVLDRLDTLIPPADA